MVHLHLASLAGPLTGGRNDPRVSGDARAGDAGEAIPIGGRTDAVVDAFDALTRDQLTHDHPGRGAALTPTEWGW